MDKLPHNRKFTEKYDIFLQETYQKLKKFDAVHIFKIDNQKTHKEKLTK